jgi:hypothetical protein
MYYETSVLQFSKMLRNMNNIIDKATAHAAAKKFDMEVLLNSRLAPDQFNFIRQVQILCDTAKRGAAQLTAKEAPVHEDKEETLDEVKARIQSVINYLETFKESDFDKAATVKISQSRWEGQHLNGKEFLIEYMIPNFYFHLTTAYAILRHNGVDVGKKDYLGALPFKK